MTGTGPRRLDHVVMPVPSLDAARAVLSALGFTVAADARHPFGTENACVFFADGTYIEPLAVGTREVCEAEAQRGNVFVAHDQAFRFRRGTPGFSGLAFGSADAAADEAGFRAAGIGDGEMLTFRRTAEVPDRGRTELGFRLAFARDRRAPDLSLFTCEPLHAPPLDRSALAVHANGVSGISRIVLSEPNPTDFQYLLQDVARERSVTADSFGFSIDAANVAVEVTTPVGLAARYGGSRGEERGAVIEGLILKARDLAAIGERCREAGLGRREIGGRLIVPLGASGTAFLGFEAAPSGA